MRAQMRVRITMPSKDGKRIKTAVLALVDKVEDDDWADEWELARHDHPLLHPSRLHR
jgi:ribosome maturation protein SDO1